jgi:hypothetical protein
VVGPPDWVGVGAQRCGTSWLFLQLMQHPESYLSGRHKERHFFDQFFTGSFEDGDVERYHRLFPRPPGRRTGEWTPRYMHDFWTPPLLARAAPQARHLVMLRDPIERFRSALAFRRRRVATAPRPHRGAQRPFAADAADALSRSLYAGQLQRLFDFVCRERVLVLQFEWCMAEPERAYAKALEFLGYDDTEFVPETLLAPKNAALAAKPELSPTVRDRLRAELQDDVVALAAALPDEVDLARWPHFAHLA